MSTLKNLISNLKNGYWNVTSFRKHPPLIDARDAILESKHVKMHQLIAKFT